MQVRPTVSSRFQAPVKVDLVVCATDDQRFSVLFTPAAPRNAWALPQRTLRAGAEPGEVAAELAMHVLGRRAAWMAQVGAAVGTTATREGAALSLLYVAVTDRRDAVAGTTWRSTDDVPPPEPLHHMRLTAALVVLRDRMDREPVAFRLLPATFTLSELQQVYELLLGRLLHKASFRRMLQAAYLVQPTDLWRSDGRGRPAQLFRYAPRRRRQARESLRFDLLTR